MRLGVQVIAFLGVLGCAIPSALAFGPTGHGLVGVVAENYLCADAKREIDLLLNGETLARAGLWPDWIRSKAQWEHSKPWHYINVDDDEPVEGVTGQVDGDVIQAIIRFRAELADERLDAERRANALRFLAHSVPDVHQPLHVGRASDRGGNTISMRVAGKKTNLHALWDAESLLQMDGLKFNDEVRLLAALAEADSQAIRAAGPLEWARESQALRGFVYAFPSRQRGFPVEPDAAYLSAARTIIRLRLAQAAARLARQLNDIFCEPGRAR